MGLGRVPKGYESETKNAVMTARKKAQGSVEKKYLILCASRPENILKMCA